MVLINLRVDGEQLQARFFRSVDDVAVESLDGDFEMVVSRIHQKVVALGETKASVVSDRTISDSPRLTYLGPGEVSQLIVALNEYSASLGVPDSPRFFGYK
ncbi:MAG: hypothetical protein H6502_04190 [Candidatus Woesearchaeota archaeon]|nr:MAG: hypothetical protein H6502_04190 [Candidatus Woesearchaeota archaeon]